MRQEVTGSLIVTLTLKTLQTTGVKYVPGFDTTETMMLSNSELCLCILHIYDAGSGGFIYVTSVCAEHFPPVVTLEC